MHHTHAIYKHIFKQILNTVLKSIIFIPDTWLEIPFQFLFSLQVVQQQYLSFSLYLLKGHNMRVSSDKRDTYAHTCEQFHEEYCNMLH